MRVTITDQCRVTSNWGMESQNRGQLNALTSERSKTDSERKQSRQPFGGTASKRVDVQFSFEVYGVVYIACALQSSLSLGHLPISARMQSPSRNHGL